MYVTRPSLVIVIIEICVFAAMYYNVINNCNNKYKPNTEPLKEFFDETLNFAIDKIKDASLIKINNTLIKYEKVCTNF